MSWADKVTPVLYRWSKQMPWLRSSYHGLRQAKKLLPGRKSVPGPVESILDLEDILNTSEGEIAGVLDHAPLREAWSETRVLPRSIDSESHWKFTQYATCEHPATFVLTLSNGRACGAGSVITRDNKVLLPVSPYIEKGAMREVSTIIRSLAWWAYQNRRNCTAGRCCWPHRQGVAFTIGCTMFCLGCKSFVMRT